MTVNVYGVPFFRMFSVISWQKKRITGVSSLRKYGLNLLAHGLIMFIYISGKRSWQVDNIVY